MENFISALTHLVIVLCQRLIKLYSCGWRLNALLGLFVLIFECAYHIFEYYDSHAGVMAGYPSKNTEVERSKHSNQLAKQLTFINSQTTLFYINKCVDTFGSLRTYVQELITGTGTWWLNVVQPYPCHQLQMYVYDHYIWPDGRHWLTDRHTQTDITEITQRNLRAAKVVNLTNDAGTSHKQTDNLSRVALHINTPTYITELLRSTCLQLRTLKTINNAGHANMTLQTQRW